MVVKYNASWAKHRKAAGITGWQWEKTRQKIFKRFDYLCQECKRQGRTTRATDIDHIKALAAGGSFTDEENMQPLCRECHIEKTIKDKLEMGVIPRGCDINGEPHSITYANREKQHAARKR